MGPLVRRSPLRLLRDGPWGLLVAGAFLLVCSAAASAPIFAEASGNAAFADQLAAVPATANAGSAPVVRLVGGAGLGGRDRLGGMLDRVPGLGPATVTATSVGVELEGRTVFTPFVAANGRTERARLFGDDDVEHALVADPGWPSRVPAEAIGPALWLPAPIATALGVTTGDTVEVGVESRASRTSTPVEVAGVYAVDGAGRLPADPPGTRRWALRQAFLPKDSEFTSSPAYVLVGDVAAATEVAKVVGDSLLFAVEGQLSPAVPTLAAASATVAGIRRLQADVRDPALLGETPDRLHQQVASGLPDLVRAATDVADRTVAWTSTLSAAGAGLGLMSILAVAALGTVRRAIEVKHSVGVGLRPAAIGGLAALEVVPTAVASWAAGFGLAALAVAAIGPPGAITTTSLTAGAWRAGLAALAGIALVGCATTVAAARAARLTARHGASRSVPWEVVLGAVAATATMGLLVRPAAAGPPSALDLIVPLLVLAATGAIGTRLTLAAAGKATRRRTDDGVAGAWARRPALMLALRRVVVGGSQKVLVVTILSTGLGLLAYSVAAAVSVSQVAEDRAAVRAGASATTEIEVSWLLDDGAAQVTPDDDAFVLTSGPMLGVRTPPLPAGTTIVWRSRVTMPAERQNVDLLVIDPARFAAVAAWGGGPELARSKALLPTLTRADATLTDRLQAGGSGQIPAIGVGTLEGRPGEGAAVSTDLGDLAITLLDVVPAFPGHSGNLPMIVVPADSFFGSLGAADPRVRPPATEGRFSRAPRQYFPSLWSNGDPDALRAVLEPRGLELGLTETLAQVAQEPDLVAARRSLGLQVALGLCVAAIAVLALAMFADRATSRARASDLMLALMGMGRAGTQRARSIELGLLAGLGLALAGVGVLLVAPLGARLLDPGGGAEPAFVLRLGGAALVAAALAAVVCLLVAIAVVATRSGRADSAKVLRDAD
ncbi:hypothetical protein [Pengzhenrongella frigida]|uniref:FtsX-like permease family protein n=1 Tax=Pengzhenrongella frigida TaxID=1259133 RepID=A0A4Q5MVY5_9MICO|nr:hypothetical protein [Cellulomonas sp. HLT2-17]RYV49679.1 hypothetical protein EUA98_17535 [Cellulomonas sp. HLT2-17]